MQTNIKLVSDYFKTFEIKKNQFLYLKKKYFKALIKKDSNDIKRQRIGAYFLDDFIRVSIILCFLIGLITAIAGIGIVLLVIGFILQQSRTQNPSPDDRVIDLWFAEDIEDLKRRSLERLNIDESELTQDSVIIQGPILWNVSGSSKEEIMWRKGDDGKVRCNLNSLTIIHLTEHKMSSYQCDFNFLRGIPLNERDDEFFYQDVVSISTRDVSAVKDEENKEYTLPSGQMLRQVQIFKLSVSSGDNVNVIVNSKEIREFVDGSIESTGLDAAIRALRKVLGEKKV
ncbi:hypothetical protein IQ260_07360 [Leptolyngbya cf. ectocarpi LEGE 11479]|uniref:Uncharacterized protein n=1 Tax=Leptolyngbya cf. ectocarpi LEGE 11479 TaxID=1828722 RepID=A0A928X111_LEPEC|nr:hypothetical protein [Leptolyngbya ectocarpi]MBE9066467.1 hypothetical protein [Leptolyngbya cf. ectocarpi LEGE 11479]